MYHLKLAKPIILDEQLATLAPQLVFPVDLLRQIAGHDLPSYGVIITETEDHHPFDLIPLYEKEDGAWRTTVPFRNHPAGSLLCGTDAICWICGQRKVDFTPLENIDIPIDVYKESNIRQWHDISCLYMQLVERNGRLKRFIEMKAPQILILNEERMTWEAVEMLESSSIEGHSRTWPDGRVIGGLNRVGYSLLTGWGDDRDEGEDEE